MIRTILSLFLSFAKVGFCSFGGMSIFALASQEILLKGWLTQQELSDIMAIAEMTPGSFGINVATFTGIRIAGIGGALGATLGVLTPSLTLTMLAAVFFARFKGHNVINQVLYVVRPVILGLILYVVYTLVCSNIVVDGSLSAPCVVIALVSSILLFRFKWSIPKIILMSGLLSLFLF